MNLPFVFAIAALACALFLVFQTNSRVWAIVAAVVAGLELLIALGLVRLSVAGIPLGTLLGLALAVAGVFAWLQVQGKTHVSAATLIAAVGTIQSLLSQRI